MTRPVPSAPPVPGAQVIDLRAGHRHEALGVGTPAPRLSWRTETTRTGWVQAADELEATDLRTGNVTRSGRMAADDVRVAP